MYFRTEKNNVIATFGMSLMSGFIEYTILSILLIPERILIPISIVSSVLIFGVISYYFFPITASNGQNKLKHYLSFYQYKQGNIVKNIPMNENLSSKGSFFALLYFICIVVVIFSSYTSTELFLSWQQIDIFQLIQLVSAISISFFMPGYAITNFLAPKNGLKFLPRFLLSYIISIFITGITVYISASLGAHFSTTSGILIAIQALIFTWFISFQFLKRRQSETAYQYLAYTFLSPFLMIISKGAYKKWAKQITNKSAELIVFTSLFTLVVVATYVLYGGVIIGDQWFHHGRALSLLSTTFYDASLADEHLKDPPFFSCFIAGMFSMSGVPTVNAYAAISFVNLVPVFAFYYFFSNWVPRTKCKAALLASVLFFLSSGFGWLYLVYLSELNQVTSANDSLSVFNDARIKTFDIFQPSSFVGVDHPAITSPLIVICLPAGFTLLGLINEKEQNKVSRGIRIKYLISIIFISFTGAISHPEFNLFIIVASLVALVFGLRRKQIIYTGLIISLCLLSLTDLLPGHYISAIKLAGIPLVYLSLAFTAFLFAVSVFKAKISRIIIPKKIAEPFRKTNLTTILSTGLVCCLAYLYVVAFVVWSDQGVKEIQIQTSLDGQQIIPWYVYPIKIGICGLIGLFFLASLLFRRFEKEILVFGIFALLALLIGPYYDEHRFSKYIMVGLTALTAVAVYDLTTFVFSVQRNVLEKRRVLRLVLASSLVIFIIISAGNSSILYVGYSALAMDNHYDPFDRDLPKRHFPSPSEIDLLRFIFKELNKDERNYNVATTADQYLIRQDGFTGKLEAFVGIPRLELLQGRAVLESSTMAEFLQSLTDTNTKYIVLPIGKLTQQGDYYSELPMMNKTVKEDKIPASVLLTKFKEVYENDRYVVLSVPDALLDQKKSTNNSKEDLRKYLAQIPELTFNDFIRIPGDISEKAKQKGEEIPVWNVVTSQLGISAALIVTAVGFLIVKLLNRGAQVEDKKL